MRSVIIFGGIGAFALATGLFLNAKKEVTVSKVSEASASSSSALTARGPASAKISVESYEFSRQVKAVLHGKKSDKNFADFNYHGLFFVEWKDASTASISFQLEGQGAQAAVSSKIPFELSLDHGIIQKMKAGSASDEADQDALNILKDFSTILAYRSDEDTTGKYKASYTVISHGGGEEVLVKQKVAYLVSSLNSSGAATVAATVIEKSRHELRINPVTQALQAASGLEKTSVAMGNSESHLLTTSEYKLVKKGYSTRVLASVQASPLTEIHLDLASHASTKGVPWTKLLQSLGGFQALSQSDRLGLFHDLVAALQKDPKNLKSFLDWASANGADAGLRTFAIGVLATMGSDDAQKALVQWFQQYPDSRSTILNAFTTTDAAFTPDTKSFLSSLIDQKGGSVDATNYAYGAAFALGSGIKNDSSTHSSQNTSDISRLETLLNAATTPQEQVVALSAMGNSGSEAFMPTIEKNLSANDESVRENAVLALRLMPTEDTLGLVVQAWGDQSIKVQGAAIQVIGFQGDIGQYQAVLDQCVQNNTQLRDACLKVIQDHQHS